MTKTEFCQTCGRPIKTIVNFKNEKERVCLRHGKLWKDKEVRQRIGKWSGPSKRFKGGYERD